MPEELDADVEVVSTTPAEDEEESSGGTVDVPEENIERISGEESDTETSGSRGFRTVDEIAAGQEAGTIEIETGDGRDTSQDSGSADVPTVEGPGGFEQAVASVEDPETGRVVRVDDPAVAPTGEPGDPVRTGELTGGERREVIVEGPGGSGVEAAPGATGLARQRIEERRENLRQQQQQERQVSQRRQRQAEEDRQRIDPNQSFRRPSPERRRNVVERLGENIERPENIPAPVQPSITAERPDREEAFLYSTNREYAQGTNIPGESFFDFSQPTTTGIEGTGVTQLSPEPFPSPAGQGLQTQREVSGFLQDLGVDEQTATNIGRSIGTAEIVGRSATTGIVEAPEQVSRFIEDPEEELERTIQGLERTETAQVATTPEEAIVLGGSDVQERARLRQESFGAELAIGGVTSAGAGVAAGGAVRGVNAPTFRFLRDEPDVTTETFQGQFIEDRLAASETDVTETGEIAQGQQFVEIGTRGQTRGVVGEESTQGITEQPLTFIRTEDPEGTRTFATTTRAGFEATDEATEGIAQADLLEISRDDQLRDIGEMRTESVLQDFRVESVSDEIIRGRAGDTQLRDIESALFGESGGEEFRGLARTDVRQQREEGITETFSRVQGAAREDQPTVAEGTFITEENLEPLGITRRIDADERFGRPFSQRELTEEDLQDLEQISEDLFGQDLEEQAQRTDTETDIDTTPDRETDTGEGQQLMQETEREMTEFEEQTLGVGVEQAVREATEQGVQRSIRREFEPLDTNAFDEVTGSIISGTSISTTDTNQLTGFGQEQQERQRTRQRQDQQLDLGETQRQEQDQIINQVLGQDTEQETQQRQRRELDRPRPPRDFDFGRGRTPGGGGFGFDFGDSDTTQDISRQETDAQRGFQRTASIDAIITGDVQTVSEEEFEELEDEEFTGLESRSILRVENGDENDNDLNRQLGI